MPKVIVIGSANMDFTIAMDRLPAAGETVLGREFYQSYGGKGANQAIAARRAGADVVFLTKIGTDANGRLMEKHFGSSGLPPTGILRDPKMPTGVALIMVDRTGTNQIAVAPGSNQGLTAEEVQRASPLMAGARVLLVQLEIPLAAVHQALTIAKKHRVTTILNPAPAQPLSTELLKLVDILTTNTGEARRLGGQETAEEAARVFGDSVAPVFEHGLVELVGCDHQITPDLSFVSTPGYTPGHCSVAIRSGAAEAVITGDLMHHPSQCAHPEWPCRADVDKDLARATRRAFLERYSDSGILVIGTHWGGPTAVHVTRRGAAWRVVW